MIENSSSVLKERQAVEIAEYCDTPTYVYSQRILEEKADEALAFPNAFGLTVRYAMKANPNANILRIFTKRGINIDASSEFEVKRAIKAGVPPGNILLTSQQAPENLCGLVEQGVRYTACSLSQLHHFGTRFPNQKVVSVRINPGCGSGHSNRTNTGGPASSFGIWHEDIPHAIDIARQYDLRINRIHSHIGSGSDPKVWEKVALMNLDIVSKFVDAGHHVDILNLGGGYKVGRMLGEVSTSLMLCGIPIKEEFIKFEREKGRKLGLEIEPGTYLVAKAGALLTRVIDVKKTPKYNFVVVDSGMTELTRIPLYGAQHPIDLIPAKVEAPRDLIPQIFVGHCCESGDILTPKPRDPEGLRPRVLPRARKGDLVVIGGTGAYCSSMSVKNYNSFPEAAEVLINKKGKCHIIRRRQSLDQIIQNEVLVIR